MRLGTVGRAGPAEGPGARAGRRYEAAVDYALMDRAHAAAADLDDPVAVLTFIRQELEQTLARIAELQQTLARFESAHARARSAAERRRVTLDFVAALNTSQRVAVGDRLAFRRWLDLDAVAERCRNRIGEGEKRAATLAERAGAVADAALAAAATDARTELWRRLDLERTLGAALYYGGDERVPRAAFAALVRGLREIPVERREPLVGHNAARLVYQLAQDPQHDVWAQCEALALLATIPDSGFKGVARQRLAAPGADPDLFVRARLVGLLRQLYAETEDPEVLALVEAAAEDPSPYVRQGVCRELPRLQGERGRALGRQLLLDDATPQVRAAAAHALGRETRPEEAHASVAVLTEATRRETDPFVLRVLVDTLAGDAVDAVEAGDAAAGAAGGGAELALGALDALHTGAAATAVRREAAMAAERIRVRRDPELGGLAASLGARAARLRDGRWCRLPRRLVRGYSEAQIGRVLAVLAQDDFSYELGWGVLGPWLRRGERAGFRLWRFLYEMRRPSSDKRQGHSHTRGRVFHGALLAPSAVLAEVSPTKVPGEPLHIEEEQGWRPYLPLPDHVVSAVDAGRRLRLFTAEGVTTVEPPSGLVPSLRAKLRLTGAFQRFAEARNWTHVAAVPASRYAEMLRQARIGVRLEGYGGARPEPRAARFFAAGPLAYLGLDRTLLERFQTYFLSVYQNSLRDLLVFIVGVGGLFLLRRAQLFRRMVRSRRRLPLVLGGWGTRGKSGTERLKAGLMNALGYAVFSKTTGCEAMFLYAPAHRPLRELFLFRPYDKATIWEQAAVARLADRLGSDVFLWECMGLTPSYARILQEQWMRDDLSTLTNTYPDHEDLQGPAGRDIPYAMTAFIPRRSRLVTSEQQMAPILREACAAKGTRFTAVGWREPGLLTEDVLARFPYEEHPANIALVMRMAEELGVSQDFALKEMADRVVPDLGVLKTFPAAPVRGRRLQFVNGMSANERYGTLANWTRMGFDRQDPAGEPGVVVSTVVNNRADRVARSRVFASMLVQDLSADRHVLIGTNLAGLTGYIEEALAAYLAGLSLWPQGAADDRGPEAILASAAAWLRQVRDDGELAGQLAACLPGEGGAQAYLELLDEPERLHEALARDGVAHAASIVDHVRRWRGQRDAYRDLQARLARASGPDAALDDAFRRWWAAAFRDKLVVIHDSHAAGDGIIERLTAVTPPGHLNRIMGIQNIKGAGLDFVYRWQAWAEAYAASERLVSPEPQAAAEGLRRLHAFREHGALTYETVQAAVADAMARPEMQSDVRHAYLCAIRDAAEAARPDQAGGAAAGGEPPGPWRRALDLLESFLDAGDAVRRRRVAERVYRDMVAERISYERASRVLHDLTKRQEGGWLYRAAAQRWQRWTGRADPPAGGR